MTPKKYDEIITYSLIVVALFCAFLFIVGCGALTNEEIVLNWTIVGFAILCGILTYAILEIDLVRTGIDPCDGKRVRTYGSFIGTNISYLIFSILGGLIGMCIFAGIVQIEIYIGKLSLQNIYAWLTSTEVVITMGVLLVILVLLVFKYVLFCIMPQPKQKRKKKVKAKKRKSK